ncbi:MAG TPA: chromosomal replication initiator protein DnaA [Thermoleophilaceae bacterium]|nr:chromosomal replication initiator protein DnaA [Thermoleophilaceae bacterium]
MPLPGELDPPLPHALQERWDKVERVLRKEVTDFTFHIWLEPLEPVGHVADTLFLRAPDHIRTWVEDSFLPLLRRAAETSGAARSVEIVDARWRAPAAAEHGAAPVAGEPLNPRYMFERFVICDGNRLAHGAALAVAEQPAQAYNPLFVHGPPGLGKTHLLHAIGNYVQAFGAGLTVRYVTVEDFTSEFVRAVRSGETRAFRERFRDADVLLVDDVQFLAEKLRTEEEFFHTFNALYEAGSQLVITSDRRPRDIEKLEVRLRERFECGLVAQLDAPSLEARLAILEQRARADALAGVGQETLAAIARHVTTSVRALEGALIRVVAYASLRGEEPTPELAQRVLETLYGSDPPPPSSLADIQRAAASALDVPVDSLLAQDRRPRVALARQVAMYLARELTDQSLPAIGRHFGGRNHSTVLHAHRRIASEIGKRPETAGAVERARSELGAGSGADRR